MMLSRRSAPSYLIEPWQSKTDAVLAMRGPPLGSPAMWTLLLMMAVLGALSYFVEIDRTVTSTGGKIIATEATTTFQALDPSIIKTIEVREGEEVRKGQLLATLDPTFAAADVGQLRRQVAGLDALIDRAYAEQTGKSFKTDVSGSVGIDPYAMLQMNLFSERAAQLRAQVLSFDEKIKAAQASIAKVQADEGHLVDRVAIAKQVEGMKDTLYKSGSSSLLTLLGARDSSLELQRSLENDKNSLVELQHQISSLQSDRDSAIQNWYAASSQELIAAKNQRETARAALEKAEKHQDLVRIVASEASMVLTLTKLSAGSVLKEGDPVMSLMPLNAPVKAEIQFSAADIGFVRPGNSVALKIDAFNYIEHGSAEGKLDWISEGSFTTDENGKTVPPFYLARVTIEERNFVNVPSGFRLIPGMTLEADIDVGKQSLSRYVFGTLIHGFGEALREP